MNFSFIDVLLLVLHSNSIASIYHPPFVCQPASQKEKVTLLQLHEVFILLIYGLLTLSAAQIT